MKLAEGMGGHNPTETEPCDGGFYTIVLEHKLPPSKFTGENPNWYLGIWAG